MTSTLHIVVAMKPLDGNFASNAIKHGVAGLNIDACRIGFTSKKDFDSAKFGTQTDIRGGGLCTKRPSGGYVMAKNVEANPQGRFPANVIISHKKGCRLVGISKVGGDKPRGIDAAKSRSWKNQSVAGIARVGYADADGKEITEVWECEEGCPVKAFPSSGSGNGKGVYSYAGREYDNKDTSMFNGDKPQAPSNFNDSGSAARFFKQVKED